MSYRWLVPVLLVVGACAESAGPVASPDEPVVGTPVSPTPIPGPSFQEVEPREGLVEVRPHIFDRAEQVAPKRIRIEFYGGIEECEGLARVNVEETDETVTITLYTGRVPTADVCIEIAVLKATTVELDSPLAGRKILDGAP